MFTLIHKKIRNDNRTYLQDLLFYAMNYLVEGFIFVIFTTGVDEVAEARGYFIGEWMALTVTEMIVGEIWPIVKFNFWQRRFAKTWGKAKKIRIQEYRNKHQNFSNYTDRDRKEFKSYTKKLLIYEQLERNRFMTEFPEVYDEL
jgi:hypothetical protein